eukprot:6211833-Pleurochrysis_carterae.AAC.2
MVALVAHEAGAQHGGELFLGCDEANVAGALVHVEEWRPIAVRAGQLPTTLRGGAFARWRMGAWCIGRRCGVIG